MPHRCSARRTGVRIGIDQFQVVGNAHVLPGIPLDPYVLRTRIHFLAMTGAHVFWLGYPAWERSAPVALVNVRPLEELIEVSTIS
jgi:hypothetical protein